VFLYCLQEQRELEEDSLYNNKVNNVVTTQNTHIHTHTYEGDVNVVVGHGTT
jgi:hypothetical protein